MIEQIKITVKDFVELVQKHRIMFTEMDNRKDHIDIVLKEQWPEFDKDEILITLALNYVNKELDKKDRKGSKDITKWIETKQMSLFNEPAFRLPQFMYIGNKKKKYQDVSLCAGREILNGFYEQTKAEAEEFAKAWEKKTEKKEFIGAQLDRIDQLIGKAQKSGYDPEVLTFGEAEQLPPAPKTMANTGISEKTIQ